MTTAARIPLKRDEKLYAAFAEERERHPYRAPSNGSPAVKPENCANEKCRWPLRSHRQTLQDMPGTRRRAGHGLCQTCYDKTRRPKRERL